MTWFLPVLSTAGAFFMGKSSGGGTNIEVGTSKKDIKTIEINAPYMPYVNQPYTETTTTFISNSPNAQLTTKKEGSATWDTSLPQTISPQQIGGAIPSLGSSDGTSSGINIFDIVIIGGVGFGAYLLLSKPKK